MIAGFYFYINTQNIHRIAYKQCVMRGVNFEILKLTEVVISF